MDDEIPVGPMPVDPAVPVAADISDPRADLELERRLDQSIRSVLGMGVGMHFRVYATRRLEEVLGDIREIDEQVSELGARRREAVRLARRYRQLVRPRVDPRHEARRAPHWYSLGRPTDHGTAEPLAGCALRDACVQAVVEADDALTVTEVRAALVARGFDAAPSGRGRSPWNKAIADALRAGVRAGTLRRREFGVYEPAGGPRRPVPTWLEAHTAFTRRVRQQRPAPDGDDAEAG